MSVQKINVLVLPQHRLAPGAAWIADAVATLLQATAAQLARWREKAAAEAAARSLARDRRRLQLLAANYMSSQPSFAKELLAASMNEIRN